ncbi:UNVERIFIED_CONTAM: Retrovirus-related Pol polyprotein from transposon opus [Sesamum indicum]
MEEASRNAIMAYERRTQPIENETARRRVVRERETERVSEGMSRRAPERRWTVASSQVGSSSRRGWQRREPAISRADVDSVDRQIHLLGKQIDELKRRGELVTQNKHSPFCNKILSEVVNAAFKMPDLPNYDGLKNQQEHVSAFDLVMNLYGQSDSIKAKLFVTTLTGKAQEWFTSLPVGSIKSHEQLRDNETLKIFMGRFNNETLEVQDLRIDMMRSTHYVEQLMRLAEKYINEEEMNAMKDGEWLGSGRSRDHEFTAANKFSSKYCIFHRERGHDIEECYQLKDEIERLIRHGYFKELVLKCRAEETVVHRSRSRSHERAQDRGKGVQKQTNPRDNAPVKDTIYTIAGGPEGGDSGRSRKRHSRNDQRDQLVVSIEPEEEIMFGNKDVAIRVGSQNDPMVIRLDIANFVVRKVLIDNRSLADIILRDVLVKMRLEDAKLEPVRTPLVRFGGVGEVICDQEEARKCYNLSLKNGEGTDKRRKLEVIEGGDKISKERTERIQPAEVHKIVEVIQGNPSKTTRIGSHLGEQLETMMVSLLRKNADVFSWSSSDFVEVASEVIVHRLNVDTTMRHVQQKKRNFSTEKNQVIREEVERLLNAGYISEVQYIEWLSNDVVVPKPGGKWRVCIDFTDLNKAYPKDPYPLPRIDALVDLTAGYELFSMMDAYQGYHQIFMAEEDRSKTSFVTERGIYCYKVMPFRLKNARATYQRLVNRMFEDQIGRTMEGYLVSERGIQVNPEKIEAILKLKSPTTVKEVQKFTDKLASLNRFISKSSDRNLPFFKLLRKTKNFEWTEECEQAFQDLKTYLRSPPLLTNPKGSEVLYVYLAVSENAISSALVRKEEGVQSPIYYVSKMLQGAERRYAQIEKLALALVVTARKLRPYFQGHRIVVLTNHPLRNVLTRPEASGPRDVEIEIAARLSFPVTNNEAEYEALIMGLELALETGAKDLEVYTDSQLVTLQIEGTYETKEESMILYHTKAKSIMSKFNKCQVHQIPRHKNDRADSLSKSGATLSGIRDRKITVIVREARAIAENIDINVADERPS